MMARQMKNPWVFSVSDSEEGAFDAASRATPELEKRALRDELKNGRARALAVP